MMPNPKRPFSVTLLALGVLSITGLSLIRLILTLSQWQFLASRTAPVLYMALSGLVWAGLGAPLFWGLWRGHIWAISYGRGFALAYAGYYWVDRLLIAHQVITPANWQMPVIMTLICIWFVFWVLFRKKSMQFFRR